MTQVSLEAPYLVNSRNDSGVRQDLFFQLLLGEVRDADAFNLSGLEQVFHLLPGIFELPIEQDITAGAMGESGRFPFGLRGIWTVNVIHNQLVWVHPLGEGCGLRASESSRGQYSRHRDASE